MDDVIKMLLVSPLFQGIPEGKMTEVLQCLDARWADFEKGQQLFRQGTSLKAAGFLVEGSPVSGEGRFLGQQKHSCSRKAGGGLRRGVRLQTGKEAEYQYYSSGKSQLFYF
mgnify:CR=1 FL=1